jgi:hypothetical protein
MNYFLCVAIKRQMKMVTTTTVAMIPPIRVAGIGVVGGRELVSNGVGLGVTAVMTVGLMVTCGVSVGMGVGAGGTLARGIVRTVNISEGSVSDSL